MQFHRFLMYTMHTADPPGIGTSLAEGYYLQPGMFTSIGKQASYMRSSLNFCD